MRFFSSNVLDYFPPYLIHLYTWLTQQVTVAQHMGWFVKASNSPEFSIILTSSHKGNWFLFFFHAWSAIPDFSISPRTTAFRCSSSLTGWNDEIVLKKTTLQLYFKTFIEKINSANLIMLWSWHLQGGTIRLSS